MTMDDGKIKCNRCGKVVVRSLATPLIMDVHRCPDCVRAENRAYMKMIWGEKNRIMKFAEEVVDEYTAVADNDVTE